MHPSLTPLRAWRHVIALVIAAGAAQAQIEPAARELADSVQTTLAAAKSIKLTARHKLDPALGVGSKLEDGEIIFTIERPNRFHAVQPAERETREILYDGATFVMMYPELKHHAIEEIPAKSITQFADAIDERFGFRPPLAELLAEDFATQIFRDVTSAKLMERETLGSKTCDRLHFVQPGLTGDLWVNVEDHLPVRYLLTFTSLDANPTWEINLTDWILNAPVDATLFTKRPAADSIKVEMGKSE
jgi:hypothetical protein